MHDCIFKFESQGSSGFYHSVILSNILVDILNDVMESLELRGDIWEITFKMVKSYL